MDNACIALHNAQIFQGDNLILSDVNLTVEKGEFIYLIGKTGSGKSSLLRTLYGDLYLKEGDGEVAGMDLKKLKWQTIPQLRRNLGVIFQDFRLLTDRNVHDNLAFVLKATGWTNKSLIEEKIESVLSKVGLQSKGFKMTYEMSGGEQQRVDIARALLNNPRLILADEPTGNLDPETADEIMQLLFSICKESGAAVVMATHDYTLIRKYPARVARIAEGKVEEALASTI